METNSKPSPVPSETRYIQRLVRRLRGGIVIKLPEDPTEKPAHYWFAWFPVPTDCGKIAWLRRVWREYQHPGCLGHYGNWWYWLEKPNRQAEGRGSDATTNTFKQ